MSFFGSLFGGSNPTLNQQLPALGGIANQTSSMGLNNVGTASNFFSSLLNGNTSVLAPQISGIRKQGQQQLNTMAQFGNRSGGTNAAAQMSQANTRGQINDLVQSLTGSAAGGLASLGSSLLGTGLQAYGQQAAVSQQQMQNWQNSIFGQGISSGLGYLEGFGLGKI